MKEIRDLFRKATRSFWAAEMLLENGDVDFSASRAYYGYFYIAEALLLHEGLSFSRHGQVIGQYGSNEPATNMARPGRLCKGDVRGAAQSQSVR